MFESLYLLNKMYRLKIAKHFKLNLLESSLLYPEGIVKLNETALDILKECNGNNINQIKTNLLKKYDNVDNIDEFINSAIDNRWIKKIVY